MNETKKCLLCGETLPASTCLMSFTDFPASAQNIPNEQEVLLDRGIDLCLHQCPWCGLVQFPCEPVDYYRDVIRAGGYTTTMAKLRHDQYAHLIEKYKLGGKKFIEVGCGQGEFLTMLTDFPVQAYGIEHTPHLVEMARRKGLHVDCDFLGTADKVLDKGPFDVFLSFNFLEHQPDPNGMLKGIYNNLSENGMGLITVPSFEYILQKKCYYEFIRDHLAYYTFETLSFVLDKNGFEVLEKEVVNRDTLAVIVRKKQKVAVADLVQNQIDLTTEITTYFDQHFAKGHRVAIWGASHQGFTIAASMGLEGKVHCIIDSAPFKQGRFSPASHIPIRSPQDVAQSNEVDVVVIMAPGYTDEITKTIQAVFPDKVEIATLRGDRLEIMKSN